MVQRIAYSLFYTGYVTAVECVSLSLLSCVVTVLFQYVNISTDTDIFVFTEFFTHWRGNYYVVSLIGVCLKGAWALSLEPIHWTMCIYWEVNINIMTSSNRNIFRFTGHVCGYFAGHPEHSLLAEISQITETGHGLEIKFIHALQWWFS